MKNKVSIKLGFVIVLAALLFVSLFNPITVGYNTNIKTTRLNEKQNMHNSSFDRYALLNQYSPEINIPEQVRTETLSDNLETSGSLQIEKQKEESILTAESTNSPMDSPWPMYCHDVRHTGRSPYSTADNPGFEKWWIKCESYIDGSAAIDNNNTLYFGSWDDHFYAVDLINRSVKWKYWTGGNTQSGPAIDENGIIYVGTAFKTHGNYLYAFYPNGTLKWRFKAGDHIYSSPAIGDDGTIYFGGESASIYALYPNGTLKWKYKTSVAVLSSPAIGADGTVYCGSHDEHLYAFYPDNGTVKWKYKTGHWVRVSPCIGDDGTIYVVSLDDHLHAVNPDGTRKWTTNVGAGTSPTIGQDGIIYCGYNKLHAVNPDDGSIIWTYDVPGNIQGGTPCNSADGTIYFGTSDGRKLIALNTDGTEKWRRHIGTCEFAPIIGEDGTIYVGTRNEVYSGTGYRSGGLLHAFGELDPDAPLKPEIYGQKIVLPNIKYKYKFKSTSPLGRDIYYYVDWGDQNNSGWIGPFKSGELVKQTHTWDEMGRYTIRVKPKDTGDLWGRWGVLNPRNKATYNSHFFSIMERFPLLKQLYTIYFL